MTVTRKTQRLVSLLLIIAIILTAFPLATEDAEAASSASLIQQRIEQLKTLSRQFFTINGLPSDYSFAASAVFNVIEQNSDVRALMKKYKGGYATSSVIPGHFTEQDSSGRAANANECYGFTNFALWYIAAGKPEDVVTSKLVVSGAPLTYDAAKKYCKPGDAIRLNGYHNRFGYLGHSVLVISVNPDYITVIDSNWDMDGYDSHRCRINIHNILYDGNVAMTVSRAVKIYGSPAGSQSLEGSEVSVGKIWTEKENPFTRVYGSNRYATSYKIANEMRKLQGGKVFDCILIADGRNYPDALAGAYLAKVKNAPIIVTQPREFGITAAFVAGNVKAGGTVYILGGTGSVPADLEKKLTGFNVKRLGGKDRYETNLLILQEAGVKNEEIIVCQAMDNFADSLSASATGRPILLANKLGLTTKQKTYLKKLKSKTFYLIGNKKIVSAKVESDLKAVRKSIKTIRVGDTGKTVYARSLAIAKVFFGGEQKHISLAPGGNFADGLCGGPLAMLKGGPLILCDSKATVYTPVATFYQGADTDAVTIYGGDCWVSDDAGKAIMGYTTAN